MKKLFHRHAATVDAYMKNGLNQRKALRTAGYSDATINTGASHVFSHPAVKAEIERRMKIMFEEAGVDEAWVISRLKEVADFNVVDATDDDWNILDKADMNHVVRAGIGEIEVHEIEDDGGIKRHIKIKSRDKLGALDKLARHLGMYNDSITVKDEKDKLAQLAQARKRASDQLHQDPEGEE